MCGGFCITTRSTYISLFSHHILWVSLHKRWLFTGQAGMQNSFPFHSPFRFPLVAFRKLPVYIHVFPWATFHSLLKLNGHPWPPSHSSSAPASPIVSSSRFHWKWPLCDFSFLKWCIPQWFFCNRDETCSNLARKRDSLLCSSLSSV